MKRWPFLLAAVLGGLVAVNATVARGRHCGCPETCWCTSPVGRHLRWVLPVTHGGPLRESRLG